MMDALLNSIQSFLEYNGYECTYIANPDGDYFFVDIYINCEVIRLKCIFPESFPYDFPKIYILEEFYQKYSPLPHVGLDGYICTFDKNIVFPNNNKPKEITLETIRQAERVLIDGINGNNLDDFRDELLAYWELDTSINADLIYNPGEKPELLFCYRKNKNYIYLSNDKDKLKDYLKYAKGWKVRTSQFFKALYIPIETEWNPPFPENNKQVIEKMYQEKYFNYYLSYMKDNRDNHIIIFSQKIDDTVCVCGYEHIREKTPNGFRKNNINPIYLYCNLCKDKLIKKIQVNRLDYNRIYTRGGDGIIRNKIKVSITGCGSVGSHLAKTLADLGINNFSLIDNENLVPANIARHYCGASYIRKSKVEAIKAELLKHYPDINCDIFPQDVFDTLKNNLDMFNNCDFNFIVVGNLPIERKFLSLINEKKITKPIILIWVEPYLIGGHAVIVQTEKNNIEDILYDSNFNFKNRILMDGDSYIKKEAGCQSTFLPYSGFEVQIFLNTIIDYINKNLIENKIEGNYLLSWAGRLDKARKLMMKVNSSWLSSNGRELKVERLD